MIIDPSILSKKEQYKLLIGTVVPRPIAWVSTVSDTGVYNLAPFSFYTVVCTEPAMLGITITEGNPDRGTPVKDTLANIQATGEFVINLVTRPLADAMHVSSSPFAPDVNEFLQAGLTPVASERVKAPRVQESPINMECVLEQIVELGHERLVIGRLVRFHIEDKFYLDGKVDVKNLQVVGRLAGNYSLIEDIFELPTGK